MFLDAAKSQPAFVPVESQDNVINGSFPLHSYMKWESWAPSQISHHGKICCEIAREWLAAMDRTELGPSDPVTGPRWLRQRFKWGSSTFPIYWCEALEKKTLDCGALAALAEEVYKTRGVSVLRAQIVQRFSEVATFQWNQSWESEHETLPWTHGALIYHEGCAVVAHADTVKVWDSSAGWWIGPKAGNGYGSLLALKLTGAVKEGQTTLNWGRFPVPLNEWFELPGR